MHSEVLKQFGYRKGENGNIRWSIDLEGGGGRGKEKGEEEREGEGEEWGGGEGRRVSSPPLGLLLWNCRGWPRPAGLVQWKSIISTLHFVIPLSLKRISHKISESQLESSQVQALPFAEIINRLPNNMRAESTHSNAIHHWPSTAYMNCWNCLSCFEPQPFFFLPQVDSP